MPQFHIAVIPGDGVGPEVTAAAETVLEAVGKRYGHRFTFTGVMMGGCAIDACGDPLPEETLSVCRESDSVLLGAVGGPKWDGLRGDKRPEAGLLRIRSELGLFANLRPAILFPALKGACVLREDIVRNGFDLLIVRELTGGLYFGERGVKQTVKGETYFDTMEYTEAEVRRIAEVAFRAARSRKKRLTSVDKANVLDSSRMWRRIVIEVSEGYPDVSLDHMYVDNASMQLIRDPGALDVIVTCNMFGDILSDEASQVTGSIGMLPSASLGEGGKFGIYEPVHGSAPDIAGKDIANPVAAILSAAMMLRYSFGLAEEALCIEDAVTAVLDAGTRTADIAAGGPAVGCGEMCRLITGKISS